MRIQSDYETERTLAVFDSPAQATAAVDGLRSTGIPETDTQVISLRPGSYQCVDPFFGEQIGGTLLGAAVGAPIGAALGTLVAVAVAGTWEVVAWLCVAGLGAGLLVGSIIGAEVRARYDDDIAQRIDVSRNVSAVLVQTDTANGQTGRARRVLRRARPVCFLDASVYPQPAEWDSSHRPAA